MRKIWILCAVILPILAAGSNPYEDGRRFNYKLPVNKVLFDHWDRNGITPPRHVSDSVFLRRVTLTLAGRLPTASEVRAFLSDRSPDKRAVMIEKILNSPDYADMQAMRFAAMLRIKSEFPINLWPNAVQLWHRVLHEELGRDRSLREMFYEMLTASGSNFRVAHANFFRASADRSPAGLASMVMLTCMGMKMERLPEAHQQGFAQFFSRIRYKSTYEWKEQIVYTDFTPADVHGILPNGLQVNFSAPGTEPRAVFADWLLAEKNPYFARAWVNRVWSWVFGSGISPDADDLPQLDGKDTRNAPVLPAVEKLLMAEFVKSGYSLRHLYRVILNSAAFQASSIGAGRAQRKNFAAYPIRRLEAEVMVDALAAVTGQYDQYMSVIPEPFTFLPQKTKAVTIADGSISSGVLDNFGRPPRDSGKLAERNTASADSQNLYLMNSTALDKRISSYCRRLFRQHRKQNDRLNRIYLDILSRFPTAKERQIFENYQKSLAPKERYRVWNDTVWVLFNSKEFLFHH